MASAGSKKGYCSASPCDSPFTSFLAFFEAFFEALCEAFFIFFFIFFSALGDGALDEDVSCARTGMASEQVSNAVNNNVRSFFIKYHFLLEIDLRFPFSRVDAKVRPPSKFLITYLHTIT